MKNIKYIITSLIALLLFSNICFAKKDKYKDLKKKISFPTCKQLSKNCSICSDGKMRTLQAVLKKDIKSSLNISSYACATQGKKLAKEKCLVLSDFCKICSNDTYRFTNDDSKIDSDLYECATSPRTKVGSI